MMQHSKDHTHTHTHTFTHTWLAIALKQMLCRSQAARQLRLARARQANEAEHIRSDLVQFSNMVRC